MTSGVNIYRGSGGLEAVDWEHPVASAQPGQQTVSFGQCPWPGRRYVFAARAFAGQLEEQNTQAFVYVELDESGLLVSAMLDRPADLTGDILPDGRLLLGFSYRPASGLAAAEAFEVFGDDGSGGMDYEHPLAGVEGLAAGQSDFELVLPAAQGRRTYCVVARAAGRAGPVSAPLVVAPGGDPTPVALLGGAS